MRRFLRWVWFLRWIRGRGMLRGIFPAQCLLIEEISDHSTPLPHMLPPVVAFAQSMGALGVSDDATIAVVYEQEGVFSAPRAWWMLRTVGARDVHVLDGSCFGRG